MEYRKKNGIGILFLFTILTASKLLHAATVSKMQLLMGTVLQIEIEASSSPTAELAAEAAFKEVQKLEELLSNYKESSEISKINQKAALEPIKVSEETFQFLVQALQITKKTNGAFNISVEPLTQLWQLRERTLKSWPSEKEMEQTKEKLNYKNISLDFLNRTVQFRAKGMGVDTGGIGKGYALDKALEKILKFPVDSATLNFGGELICWSKFPSRKEVAIKNPLHPEQIWGKFTLQVHSIPTAVSSSGNYERFVTFQGKSLSHILNPKTGMPVENEIRSITVVTQNGADADAYSTALFVMGLEEGKKFCKQNKLETTILYEKEGNLESYVMSY